MNEFGDDILFETRVKKITGEIESIILKVPKKKLDFRTKPKDVSNSKFIEDKIKVLKIVTKNLRNNIN